MLDVDRLFSDWLEDAASDLTSICDGPIDAVPTDPEAKDDQRELLLTLPPTEPDAMTATLTAGTPLFSPAAAT